MKSEIEFSKQALKDLRRVPKQISKSFHRWAILVEDIGIAEVRKIRGYHDEPLSGNRMGQRSVRLSKSYRLFYIETLKKEINIVNVLEVNKHGY